MNCPYVARITLLLSLPGPCILSVGCIATGSESLGRLDGDTDAGPGSSGRDTDSASGKPTASASEDSGGPLDEEAFCAQFDTRESCSYSDEEQEFACSWEWVRGVALVDDACTYREPVGSCRALTGLTTAAGCLPPPGCSGEPFFRDVEGEVEVRYECGGSPVVGFEPCTYVEPGVFEPPECGCLCDLDAEGGEASCELPVDDVVAPVTLRVENGTAASIFIPDSCGSGNLDGITVRDSPRDAFGGIPEGGYGCDGLFERGCLPLDCFGNPPYELLPGDAVEIVWSGQGLVEEETTLPQSCDPRPRDLGCFLPPATCHRAIAATGSQVLDIEYALTPGGELRRFEAPFELPADTVTVVVTDAP